MKIIVNHWMLMFALAVLPQMAALQAQTDSTATAKERPEMKAREEARKKRQETQAAMKESARKLRTRIDEIKEEYRNEKITAEEMEEAIKEASEDMAEEMEKLAREMEENVRVEVERRVEIRTKKDGPEAPEPPSPPVVSIEKDDETGESKVIVKVKDKPKSPKRTTTGFNIAFGRNTLFQEGLQQEGAVYPEMEFWRGRYSEWGLVGNTRIGASKSPLYLNYGLSLVYNKTDIGGNNRMFLVDGKPSFQFAEGATLTRSRFENHYLNAQLGFRIAPKRNQSVHLELNGFAGARFRTKQVLEYTNALNERVEETRRNNYGTNPFNYGISAAIGYDWVSLFARYELSSLFEDNSIYDYRPFSAGIRFNLM
jgi:flagellar biosynthesis GTPase FlhF